jgi:DNA ligase-4
MSITFNNICDLLESVEKITKRQPRLPAEREQLRTQEAVSQWFSSHRRALDHSTTNGGVILSMLFPHRRKDRVYGLKAPSLSKKIVKLLNFNNRQKALFAQWIDGTHGDLGAYTELAMRPWNGTSKSMPAVTVAEVDRLLTQLAASNRFSDPSTKEKRSKDFDTKLALKRILIKLNSNEAKWLVRLILREYSTLRIDETFVLKQYHFLLPDLLSFQNDFDVVFNILKGGLRSYPSAPDAAQERSLRIEAERLLRASIGVKVGRPMFHKAWSFKTLFQLTGNRAWAAEVKYDGEYCEIHINVENPGISLQIFSKNGKDATADRQGLHETIKSALRIGRPDCLIKKNCIVLGELVIYSDNEQTILPFSKIRKHVSRSGSFLGIQQDSLPHEWEHPMIVFFDVLMLDDTAILRRGLQDRRQVLRRLVSHLPGRAMRSEWTLLDFKTEDGVIDLKQAFAHSLAHRQEGLVLKPLHAPYFPLLSEVGQREPGYFIKLKKDYLSDMGGERDLGDFAVIGASFDPQVAAKSDVKPLHWTHFHVGCLMNAEAVRTLGSKPKFKIVAALSLDKCIPKADVKYLNIHGRFRQVDLEDELQPECFEIKHAYDYGPRMSVAFKKPFVAEILGGGYEKLQNENFEMLRHPRLKKLHSDRTWEDTVTMEDLQKMAEDKWEVPNASELDGHAKDVALLVKKYVREMDGSQASTSEYEATQETTQRTTPRSTQETPRPVARVLPDDAVVQETQEAETQKTWTTAPSSQFSGSTQGVGLWASKQLRMLVREDTGELIARSSAPTQPPPPPPRNTPEVSGLSESSPPVSSGASTKRSFVEIVSPPPVKRRKMGSKTRIPLAEVGSKRSLRKSP